MSVSKPSPRCSTPPLLHSEPVILDGGPHLPGKTSLAGHCGPLVPVQTSIPSSMPGLSCGPDETPSPPQPPMPPMPLMPPYTLQDSLHEDSVRGLVKLSSV
uniref:Uncharacterized protein n=1 Tax=Denticeps clupeoides TaxID=299321 RepID=A0AAY4C1M5_9TELE